MDPDPDIYAQIFEQTPVVIRYLLGVLTFGVFSLAGLLYRMQRDDIRKVNQRIDELNKRQDRTNELLLEIATSVRSK